jgi:hypothetical protein
LHILEARVDELDFIWDYIYFFHFISDAHMRVAYLSLNIHKGGNIAGRTLTEK